MDETQRLIEAGARPELHLAITHGVLTPSALPRLDRPEIRELIITDTIELTPERTHPKIRVCSIAPMMAQVIRNIHQGISLGPLLKSLG